MQTRYVRPAARALAIAYRAEAAELRLHGLAPMRRDCAAGAVHDLCSTEMTRSDDAEIFGVLLIADRGRAGDRERQLIEARQWVEAALRRQLRCPRVHDALHQEYAERRLLQLMNVSSEQKRRPMRHE